ncbi:MAG: S-layer homology domain-containing protein, partial [Oscillospiraceae bacterium]|nr:S-layer homology domain-containing protein [Oscillospiraceae bacterium]
DETAPRLTLSREAGAAHVHNGKASARLDYALDGWNAATLPLDYAIPSSDYAHLELWVYGSGGEAALSVETDAGVSPSYGLGADWSRCSVILPPNSHAITGLRLSAESAEKGTIWLDQLTLTYGRHDEAAPAVSLTLDAETTALPGRAFDAVDGESLPTLRLAYDGKALDYSFDRRTGALNAALPAYDGRAHYATLTAGDASGNLARASVYLPAAESLEPAFPDLAGHWSAGAAEYLKREGITNGSDGLYKPDANISRQEFATMLYRYLAPTEDYGGVELPFYDSEQIAPWALDAAKAMYALGIVGGSKDLNGRLCYNPKSSITRQEAATMIGRLFEKGYAAPAIGYADGASVPDWAAEHVALLGSLGVFDDFADGTFSPAAPLTRAEMASMILRIN